MLEYVESGINSNSLLRERKVIKGIKIIFAVSLKKRDAYCCKSSILFII